MPANAGTASTPSIIARLTIDGVACGRWEKRSAATPAAIGDEKLVPCQNAYPLLDLFAASMAAPGAIRSTLVAPQFEKLARSSAFVEAPTHRTFSFGSAQRYCGVASSSAPSLPAEATNSVSGCAVTTSASACE